MPPPRKYDPLVSIPEPRIVRAELEDAQKHVERLKIVLGVAEQVHAETVAESVNRRKPGNPAHGG